MLLSSIRRVAVTLFITAISCQTLAATPITIWNLGDSVTDGAGSAKIGNIDSGGLRRSMIETLIQDGFDPTLYGNVKTEQPERVPDVMKPANRIYHEGHNGFTIGGVFGGTESWLNKSPSNNDQPIYPQFVTIMIGTNDVGQAYFKAKDAKTPMNEAAVIKQMGDDLRKLVTKVTTLRPDSHVLVSSIVPAWFAYGIDDNIMGIAYPGKKAPADKTDYLSNHYVILYNHFIKTKLVPEFQKAGKKVSFVDIYPEFIGKDEKEPDSTVILVKQYGDGTHPNTIGYDKIGKTFAKAIAAIAKKNQAGAKHD